MGDADDVWLWDQARSLLEEAERIRRRLESTQLGEKSPSWGPAINVFETTTAFWVVAALPGVAPGQISVRHVGDVLVLEGRRTLREKLGDGRYLHLEIPFGAFERRLRIPSLESCTLGEWKLAEGLLWIEMRKTP